MSPDPNRGRPCLSTAQIRHHGRPLCALFITERAPARGCDRRQHQPGPGRDRTARRRAPDCSPRWWRFQVPAVTQAGLRDLYLWHNELARRAVRAGAKIDLPDELVKRIAQREEVRDIPSATAAFFGAIAATVEMAELERHSRSRHAEVIVMRRRKAARCDALDRWRYTERRQLGNARSKRSGNPPFGILTWLPTKALIELQGPTEVVVAGESATTGRLARRKATIACSI